MKSPITGKEMSLLREARTQRYREEEFPILYHYYLCADTQERFTDDELDVTNIGQVHNQYRDKYGELVS